MPSYRVDTSEVTVGDYEVAGQAKEGQDFFQHVGLVKYAGTFNSKAVPVVDMEPPLNAQDSNIKKVDAIGTANLLYSEIQKIKNFIERHEAEHASAQQIRPKMFDKAYCIVPHAKELREEDGRYIRMRFSCSGFVFEAYLWAGIHLFDETKLPESSESALRQVYAREFDAADRGFVNLGSLGLNGSGPWPVMLCGYILHSLNRDPDIIRSEKYEPSEQDATFP